MKRRKLVIVLSIVAALVIPFSVYAATSDAPAAKSVRGFLGLDFSKLTEQQKADVAEYSKKMTDLQKEFIDKMVANKAISKDQGEEAAKRIDEATKAGLQNGALFGMGLGKGFQGMPEIKRNTAFLRIDASKLNDQQKAALMDSANQLKAIQKEIADKLIADKLLTKEQSDLMLKKLDTILATDQKYNIALDMVIGKGGFYVLDRFDIKGALNSKLSDQQKTELTALAEKLKALRKVLINKIADNGTITADQRDAALKMLDAKLLLNKDNIKLRREGMKKGFEVRKSEPVI